MKMIGSRSFPVFAMVHHPTFYHQTLVAIVAPQPPGPESLAKSIGPHRCDRGLSKVGSDRWDYVLHTVCTHIYTYMIYYMYLYMIYVFIHVRYVMLRYVCMQTCIYIHISKVPVCLHMNTASAPAAQARPGRNSAATWRSRSCRMRG